MTFDQRMIDDSCALNKFALDIDLNVSLTQTLSVLFACFQIEAPPINMYRAVVGIFHPYAKYTM